ncbi:interferon-induced very large GTPase 1-like [Lissotriton helveticus]
MAEPGFSILATTEAALDEQQVKALHRHLSVRRNGGGECEVTQLSPTECRITYTSKDAQEKVLQKREHEIKSAKYIFNVVIRREKDSLCPAFPLPAADLIEDLKSTSSSHKPDNINDIFAKISLKSQELKRLTLRDVLETGPEDRPSSLCFTLEDVLQRFLKKLLSLNVTARDTSVTIDSNEEDVEGKTNDQLGDDASSDKNLSECSINPLDVLCTLLNCSDSFLQQEILLKMSMCQFALPLLLPPREVTKCTLMLWAMRDIFRKWRPHSLRDSKGFREESLVLTPMPMVSFVRLGSCSLSKSKILNMILSPPQQHHDFFIHREMKFGNVPRTISDGLVEISWYFPGGRVNSDVFPTPVAVTNLRGDIRSHWEQFSFLTAISSAVFIYVEHIGAREYELLSSLNSETTYYFIIPSETDRSFETINVIKRLAKHFKSPQFQTLKKGKNINDATFANKLLSIMFPIVENPPNSLCVEGMAVIARELGIRVDEDNEECQRAKQCVNEITRDIKDIAKYKATMMKLQGEPWKKLGKIQKELCRLKRQGKAHTENYKSDLKEKLLKLRKQQNENDLTDGMIQFITSIEWMTQVEKHYFLKWMKFELDSIARHSLSNLRDEYKAKSKDSNSDPKELAELDKRISESSLGIEHFMREMGQYYEAECSMVKEGKLAEDNREFIHLPGIAADLMLEGFPLELIDGDTSNIPIQWVNDVLTELNTKLQGHCRMIVVTVLGVQSTGKSTLLNTMFGLQFSVSSGRCTRGAFMLLMKVKEDQREELGCDFILVIDTEGLKAPELMALEDSYEHDNELATLVIGLSDITIVNMAMENGTEMKDVLQIVVHAFLRMDQIGKKPNCQFVHQNVSDISAHDQNMRDRKHLLEQLNAMTKVAARMEKQNLEMTFSDIMEYDPDKHNWYIPGLWHGVPPMAPVNLGYSEHVQDFKRYLFQFIRECHIQDRAAMNIPHFKEWVQSLWNAVKHENFIFSFRNSIVAEAYNQLAMKFSEWEWAFRKEVQLWVSEKENEIQNQSMEELNNNTFQNFKHESSEKLQTGERKLLDSLQTYFESKVENLSLIEKFREDFARNAKSLGSELEYYSFKRWEEAIRIRKGKHKLKDLQEAYTKTIEEKVVKLIEECRKRKDALTEQSLEIEFEKMWENTLSELHLSPLETREVHKDMFLVLQKDLGTLGAAANERVQTTPNLLSHGKGKFTVIKQHFDLRIYEYKGFKELFTNECWYKTEDLVRSLEDECRTYVTNKVRSRADYDEAYCRELLNVINKRLQEKATSKLHTSALFAVDLKLHIFGIAAPCFQRMHEDYLRENDPLLRLKTFRPHYFSVFKDVYLLKDESQKRARDFCVRCLKPALMEYVYKRLGLDIVDDILSSGRSKEYSSRMFFQCTVLDTLLEKNSFTNYVEYINNYVVFVKGWIWTHILHQYKRGNQLETLEKNVLSDITKKIRDIFREVNHFATVSEFLENFCHLLKEHLVISRDTLQVVLFQNTAEIGEFSADVLFFLSEIERNILSGFKDCDIEEKFSKLTMRPQDELFNKVFGCGKQCPFCKAPCEAGGQAHTEHFATVHRPQGLGRVRDVDTQKLVYAVCSSIVASKTKFQQSETEGKWHPYKDYRSLYPDWSIQPDPSISASDYWKYNFSLFNEAYAKEYSAQPADLPEDWRQLTKAQARQSLQEVFRTKAN